MATFLVLGLFLNFFEFLTRWNLRSTDFSLAIICLGRVRFRSGLPTRCDTIISSLCRGIPTAETASRILSLVFSSAVSGIPATRTKGLRPYCSSSSTFWKRSLFCFSKTLTFSFSGWVALWTSAFTMSWIWVLIVASSALSKDFTATAMRCMSSSHIVNGPVTTNVGVSFFSKFLSNQSGWTNKKICLKKCVNYRCCKATAILSTTSWKTLSLFLQ